MEKAKTDGTETAAFDVLGEVLAIKDLMERADAVMRAGRNLRGDGIGHEYPPELEAYCQRTKEEAARRMADLASAIGTDTDTVRRMCRAPQTTFRVLDSMGI